MVRTWIVVALAGVLFAAPGPGVAQVAGSPLPPSMASAGVTETQWDAIRREARVQARRAAISEAALMAAAEAAGGNFAQSGRFDAQSLQQAILEALARQADHIAELQLRLGALTGDADPVVAGLSVQARAALEEGRFADADRILAEVAARDLAVIQQADAEAERRRMRAGETIFGRGRVAFIQADYGAAADHFARAADTAPQAAIEARWRYRSAQAESLYERGRLFGDIESVRQAAHVYRQDALPLTQGRRSVNWATTQNNLGLAYAMLGERAGREPLVQAAAAFSAALEVYTRREQSEQWAAVQKNLAGALTLLNERGGEADLERAAAAYQAAATVWTRERDVVEWAGLQFSYANTLRLMGQSGDRALVRRSARVLEEVVTHLPREADPSTWAMAQANLGVTLVALSGGRGRDSQRAVAALRAALDELHEDEKPALWAQAQFNLGAVLLTQAEADPSMLEPGMAALTAAERVLTRENFPRAWAMMRIYQSLGYALRAQNGDRRALDQARRAALDAQQQFEALGDRTRANGALQVLQRFDRMR